MALWSSGVLWLKKCVDFCFFLEMLPPNLDGIGAMLLWHNHSREEYDVHEEGKDDHTCR